MRNAFSLLILSLFAISSLATTAPSGSSGKPSGRIFFVEPKDGATVPAKFTVKMGVEGYTVKEAGRDVEDKKSGHHHLIINGVFVPQDQIVPTDDRHIHFGKGQTETQVTLPPGRHTLTLQFADGAHRSYGEPMSTTITVNVEGSKKSLK